MKSLFDTLNMRPGERRALVAVVAIVFVVLNVWQVWPHFKDWKILAKKLKDTQATAEVYKREIAKMPAYTERLDSLRSAGSDLVSEAQALQLQRNVDTQARQSGVLVSSYDARQSRSAVQTNEFFQEQTLRITVTTADKELVDFLYNIGSGNSMTRVRDLDLKPDGSQLKLVGNLTLTATYQKETAAPNPAIVKKP
jgi:hypothetical protein